MDSLHRVRADVEGLDGTYWVSAWTARVCPLSRFFLLLIILFHRFRLFRGLDKSDGLMTGGGTEDGIPESPWQNHLRIVFIGICKFCRIHQLFTRQIRSERYVLCPSPNSQPIS